LAVCGDNIKDYGEQCDLTDLNGKACLSFGFDGGILSCSFACEFDTSSCVTNATAFSETIFLPTSDITYVLPDGLYNLNIDIPQDFYNGILSFFIFSHNPIDFSLSKPAPSGEDFVGKVYDLTFVNENGDIASTLNKTSTITLSYNQMDLNSIDEDSLAPYKSEFGNSNWTAISSFSQDKINKTITFTTSDFSFFTIMGSLLGNNNNENGNHSFGGSGWSYIKISPEEKKKIISIADFNNDGRVDIIDLSILLYYNEHPQLKDFSRYDLNKDGVLDIFDISIMLYYWQVTSY